MCVSWIQAKLGEQHQEAVRAARVAKEREQEMARQAEADRAAKVLLEVSKG